MSWVRHVKCKGQKRNVDKILVRNSERPLVRQQDNKIKLWEGFMNTVITFQVL
jgi:hypothetical protein